MAPRQLGGGITAALLLGAALLLAGCPAPRAPAPDEKIRWEGPVAICFLEAGEAEAELIAQVRRAAQTWMDHSGAVFYVMESCEASPPPGQPPPVVAIPAYFLEDAAAFAATDHLGNNFRVRGGEIRLKAEYLDIDPICGRAGSVGRLGCVYADALHELGHVLGFSHDHVSIHAPECQGRIASGEQTDAAMTYYDAASIMNYCNPERWRGRLSDADICSVQLAYPKPGAPRRSADECEQIAAAANPSPPVQQGAGS